MTQVHEQDLVTVREIPRTRLAAIAWLMLALAVAGVAAWEWKMRSLGLTNGDLDDSRSHWAVERRKVGGREDKGVVIIGSSRILWDSNLDVWEKMTGRRPIQLALPGTNPRQFLEDFADDEDFRDFLVVGVTPDLYFGDWLGIPQFSGLREYWREETPSQRFGHRVGMLLERQFAFLDGSYALGTLVDRLPVRDREGVRGPVRDVWKIWEVGPDRQYYLWQRIQADRRLREHARWVWGPFDGKRMPAEGIGRAIAQSKRDVAKIRARGGEVVFVRAPSAGLYYEHERQAIPRAISWEPLLRETDALGIHFEDYPEMRYLEVPEWSHLSRDAAVEFTRAYVAILQERFPALRKSHE
jgi:hypothetical protein